MAKRSQKSAEEKAAVVLAVLRRETTAVDAARSSGVSEQTIHNWKAAFVEGGRAHLARAAEGAREADRVADLEAEIRTLREALALAEVQLLGGGRGRRPLPPSTTSR